jgi:phenylalanyl-tRNA synthetase beta chain
MKLSPHWLRDFVDLNVDDRRLAEDLTAVGIAVEGISGSGENAVFEMEIGTNRPDAMNHYGVAREASAIYNQSLRPIEARLPATQGHAAVEIIIDEGNLCPRFSARVLRDLTIRPSAERVARRLALLDQHPINNAVDATNYTLWETGKPTHAFDLDLLEGGKLIIRKAQPGEKLKTLDGIERQLTSEDLVVADLRKPVALAGVMGGFDTMITERTRNILIESAWWDPTTIRKTSRRHALHTEASHRFERGADFESTVLSCDRVAGLILESGGGQLQGGIIDVIATPLDQAPIVLRVSEVHRILGTEISTHEIYRILTKLGFDLIPERGGEADFTVRVPSWRLDVEREIDLVEEIARLYGYDKFTNTLPAFAGAVIELPYATKDHQLRTTSLALGYNEAVSLSFISHEDAETFSVSPVIELANPISEEASIMRSSMLPGMLNMIAHNLNRGVDRVRLFEMGGIFEAVDGGAAELKQLCLGTTEPGSRKAETWDSQPFFDLKGDVETLLQAFEHQNVCYQASTPDYYHPGRSARALMDGEVVARFGQIHPDVAAQRKFRQEVYLAEILVDRLYRRDLRQVRYEPLAKYPAVERDFSFLFTNETVFDKIEQAANSLNIPELRSFTPVEIFRGGKLPSGKYSMLLRAKFQSRERTLREEEVADRSERIVKALESLGGVLRRE